MKKVAQPTGDLPLDLDARFDDIERRLERLRGLYESFFMGIERTPPAVPRRELNRIFVEMQQETIKNATQRFRFNSLSQRWVLLTTYWNRTLREIEAGTYRRDVEKAQRRLAKKGGELSENDAIALGIPANRVKAFIARQNKLRASMSPVVPVAGPAAASEVPRVPLPAPVAAVPGVSDQELTEFFARYVGAHKQIGAAQPGVTLDQMKARLAKEVPKILAAKNCARVQLDVVVEAGKVHLRAKPIRA